MKKNNNNQILYLSLPLYGKFTYKNQNGNERFVASKQDFISYIFIHIAKCGIRIFCMLATPIYEKGIISLLFKVFPKSLIILIDMKRQFQLTFF